MPSLPNSPINTGPFQPGGGLPGGGPLPIGSTPAYQQQQAQLGIQNQLSSQYGLGDIFSIPGDVWGWIKDHAGGLIPKNADGSIDWGKIGSDLGSVAKWIGDHKEDILTGLNVVNQYNRGQESEKYAKQALADAQKSYDERAPLRAAGIAGMLDPSAKAPDRKSVV